MRIIKDPLLSVTRRLLGIACVVMFACAVVIVAMATFAPLFGARPTTGPLGASLLVSAAPQFALYGWFLRVLRQIVDTVAAGTPFIAANAARLTRMSWIAALMKLVTLAEAGLLHTAAAPFMRFGARFGGPDLLLILALFILARLFRQGAQMHRDLEGTV